VRKVGTVLHREPCGPFENLPWKKFFERSTIGSRRVRLEAKNAVLLGNLHRPSQGVLRICEENAAAGGGGGIQYPTFKGAPKRYRVAG